MTRGHSAVGGALAAALLLSGCTGGDSTLTSAGGAPATSSAPLTVAAEQPTSLGLTWADGGPVLVGQLAPARDVDTDADFTREATIVDLDPVRARADDTLIVRQVGAVDMGSMTILESDLLGRIRAGGTMDPFTAVGSSGGSATSIVDVDVAEDAVAWTDTTSLHETQWRVLTATDAGVAAVVATSDEFDGADQIGPEPQPTLHDGRVYFIVPGAGSPGDGSYTPGTLVSRLPDGSDHRVDAEDVDWTAATETGLYVAQGREDEATTISAVRPDGVVEPVLEAQTAAHTVAAHGRWLALDTGAHAVVLDPTAREAYALPVAESAQVSSVSIGDDLVAWTFFGERSDVQVPSVVVDLRSKRVVRLTGLLGFAQALGGDLVVLRSWEEDGAAADGSGSANATLVRWQRAAAAP